MSMNGLTIGQDIRLVFNSINGQLTIPPDWITEFEANPGVEWKQTVPITGIANFAAFPSGPWEGSITVDRKGRLLDDFQAQFEAAFRNGVSIQSGSIYQTVNEPDGSVSQWLYTGTIFTLKSAGKYVGNNFVSQSMDFKAATKTPLA